MGWNTCRIITMTLPLLVSEAYLSSSLWKDARARSLHAASYGVEGTTTKNPLPAHPSPIISPTAKHAGLGHRKPFRGPLSGPAFSRRRLICSYFNRLLPREQGREKKKKKENEPSALLKRFLISHTHSQAGALPDTTALISRPENWRVSHG